MRKLMLVGVAAMLTTTMALGQSVKVVPGDLSLQQLVDSDHLVSIVVKPANNEAVIPNLRIVEVRDELIVAMEDNGKQHWLPCDSVKEVRVQEQEVEPRTYDPPQVLTGQQKQILQRAIDRAGQIFRESQQNQPLRIGAATILTLYGNEEARVYLLKLARSNDVETELDATLSLYLAGDPAARPEAPYPVDAVPESGTADAEQRRPLLPRLVNRGLDHSSRTVRGKAAVLAGLTEIKETESTLLQQADDRIPELSVPAAKALANMGSRQVIPRLLELLMQQSPEKGEAAIYGLKRLGDEETARKVKDLLSAATGMVRLRIARVLFALGEPEGRQLLEDIMTDVPTIEHMAALPLARSGDWNAVQFLRRRLERRENPTAENLRFRAKAAGAMFKGDDPNGAERLSAMLRNDETEIVQYVCEVITELGRTNLLTTVQPPLESSDTEVALSACKAAAALANSEFQARLVQYRQSR
ncbi:MAG: HEAT repeat domain-containing protein [Candidatus Hydrogenedentota bacterium]